MPCSADEKLQNLVPVSCPCCCSISRGRILLVSHTTLHPHLCVFFSQMFLGFFAGLFCAIATVLMPMLRAIQRMVRWLSLVQWSARPVCNPIALLLLCLPLGSPLSIPLAIHDQTQVSDTPTAALPRLHWPVLSTGTLAVSIMVCFVSAAINALSSISEQRSSSTRV